MKLLLTLALALSLFLPFAAGRPAAASVCPGAQPCVPTACPASAKKVGPARKRRVSMSVLQTAVDAAAPGSVLCVLPATYVGNLDFHGKAVTLISSTPRGAVLQGNGHGPVVTFDTFESPLSGLDGFTVTGGVATGGAGILISNASPTIKNCLITGNSAVDPVGGHPQGGGMYIGGDRSAPLVSCTTFQGNHSDFIAGGLISTYLAHPHLVQDSFLGNTASYGGGFAAEFSGLANIDDSQFSGNTATVDGGALHVLTPFGSTLVRRTVIQGNQAGGNGGGLWVAAGFATVLNTVFDGNKASQGGAAAAGFGSAVSVESTAFVNNSTVGSGGAALEAENLSAGTVLVNAYNLFYTNTGGDFAGTSSNAAVITGQNPLFGTCYDPAAGSPVKGAGMPDLHFDNPSGTRNDIGIYGGPNTP